MLQHATLEVPKADWNADVEDPVCANLGHVAVLERVFVRDPVGHLVEIMSAPPVGPFTD